MTAGRRQDWLEILSVMGMYFLVVCAVGILRPIKNTLALDGLAAADFYQVYLVSATVILFVPPYNRLSDRVSWRILIPAVAIFFALNLVAFRLLYREGSTAFGIAFYGWYDLFAAALVTQFFMVTQFFFTAREAKRAYPLVIGGGAVGVTLGSAITGLFAEALGTPNLLLVAAALIAVFGAGLPIVWSGAQLDEVERDRPGVRRKDGDAGGNTVLGELRMVFGDSHVRLIAFSVLLTVLVKQLVDYQFNTITKEVFQTRDAIAAFQGQFNAATQWLPFVVLVGLRPLLNRWGVGAAVFMVPAAMLAANMGLVAAWGLVAAVIAKGAETSLRYSAERTGREILYVPVPDRIKMKAKTYIDVAIEKGVGKVVSAGLIFGILAVLDYRSVPWVAAALSLAWLGVAIAVQREYVHTLARSIEGRFASLRGGFATLADANTVTLVRETLRSGNPLQIAFALDLIAQSQTRDVQRLAPELSGLLEHGTPDIRARALDLAARDPDAVPEDQLRARLHDSVPAVREAAVRALCASRPGQEHAVVRELLDSEDAHVRTATLACVCRDELAVDGAPLVGADFLARREATAAGDPGARLEVALAAGTLEPEAAAPFLERLMEDDDARVASAAIRSAGMLGRPRYYPRLITALGRPAVREAAREALVRQKEAVIEPLAERLLDESEDRAVRRNIPAVLAQIPAQRTVDALLQLYLDPETDQLLDYRTLKALSRLRSEHPEIHFDPDMVPLVTQHEVDEARRYAEVRGALDRGRKVGPAIQLLDRTLREAWQMRREGVFRCLGLVYPPGETHRCFLALSRGTDRVRANALEWLEQTLGHHRFNRIAPVLQEAPLQREAPALEIGLRSLVEDRDPWIGRCALWTAAALDLPWVPIEIERWNQKRGNSDPLASRIRTPRNGAEPRTEMDLIEKVFLLQQIDLLRDARTAHLSLLASIAQEIEADPDTVLLEQGEATDALYVLIRGAIELHGVGETMTFEEEGAAFGTWALIDESPSMVEARTVERTTLLQITRADFYDLLADNPELALGLLQGLARRVRTLVP